MSPDTDDSETATPAQLRGITEDLQDCECDAPEALKRVWAGLCVARLLGLRLGASGHPWQLRRINAESVEHQLAHDLGTTATFADTVLALPVPASLTPLPGDEVEAALEALVEFSAVTRARMLATAPRATEWHDERVLRHDSLVMGELAAAWLGNRGSYRLH